MTDQGSGAARRRARWSIGALIGSAVLIMSACGGAASPTPAASASSSAAASASTAPSASAPASAAASASPSEEPSASASEEPSPSESAAAAQELEITATDFAFDLPASVPAGATTISVVNEGAEEHQAQFARINDDKAFEDIVAALAAEDFPSFFAAIELAGGPLGVAAGETGQTGSELEPGMYALICFVTGDDGVPHLAKGQISQLEVTDSTAASELPEGDAELTMQDFAFVGLDSLPTGEQTVSVVNDGPQPHEAAIVRLSDGVTVEDLIPMFTSTEPPSGPPPFTSAGGISAIATDMRGTMALDLEPGEYAFLCFLPDLASGQPHVALGMVGGFTVR